MPITREQAEDLILLAALYVKLRFDTESSSLEVSNSLERATDKLLEIFGEKK